MILETGLAGRGTRRDTVAMTQPTTHEALFIDELRGEARRYREFADQALAQVDDAGFFATLDAESNSLALIVKHVAGNLRSRWTDFFTADGEKPDRQRDREFELEPERHPRGADGALGGGLELPPRDARPA